MLSNQMLGNIKFKSNDSHLLAWLKKEHVFIELDGLGIDHPVTIGHFIKIMPELTNFANFRDSLANQLMLIDINADTAIALVPHLKDAQLDAMTNGNEYIMILLPFQDLQDADYPWPRTNPSIDQCPQCKKCTARCQATW